MQIKQTTRLTAEGCSTALSPSASSGRKNEDEMSKRSNDSRARYAKWGSGNRKGGCRRYQVQQGEPKIVDNIDAIYIVPFLCVFWAFPQTSKGEVNSRCHRRFHRTWTGDTFIKITSDQIKYTSFIFYYNRYLLCFLYKMLFCYR